MANNIYQSEFTGPQMDSKFSAVATLQEAVAALETAVAAKYSKPDGGIPSTDMDADVQAALALALTAVQSLADYYTKAQVDAIAAAIASAVNSTSGVTVTTLPSASADTLGKIYYVGPDGNGEYARKVTSYDGTTYSWLDLGTTAIDLTQYATKAELSQLDQKVGDSSEVEGEVPMTLAETQAGAVRYNSGINVSASGCSRSGYIDITGKTTLIYSRQKITDASTLQGLAFYDSSKTYVSGEVWGTGAAESGLERSEISVPANAKYVRFCWVDRFNPDIYLKYPTTEEAYTDGLGKEVQDLREDVDTIETKVPDIPVVTFTPNIFNPDAINAGYILDETGGGIHSSSSYVTSGYIPVSPDVTYRCNKTIRRICYYYADKTVMFTDNNISANTDFKMPYNFSGFIRVSITSTGASPASSVHLGDKTKVWDVLYGISSITIEGKAVALASEIPTNIFAGKKLAIVGDSSATPTAWPSRLGVAIGVQTCDLYAYGGYTWRNQFESDALTSCIGVLINNLVSSGKTYDIILIQFGGNDIGGSAEQMGTVDAAFDSYNYKSLADATDTASGVRYWLEYLRRTFPNALLVVDTVFQRLGSKTGESAKSINDILRASCQRLGIECLDGEGEVGFSAFTEPSSPYYNDGNPGVANDRTDLSRENPTYNYIQDSTGDIVDYTTATNDGVLKTGYSKRYGLYTYDGKHQNLRGENKVLDFMYAALKSLYQSDNLQNTGS